MDRLLELLLRRFVRRGTLRFTTARGSVFTVGDGKGPPVAIRFMTKAAQRGVLLDPELKLGEAYMDGTLADRARHHRRPARDRAGSDQRRHAAELGAPAMVAAVLLPAAAAVQCPDARAAQRRASLRSRRPALLAVPRRRPAILLRLFRAPRAVARRRPARQEAPSRRQAVAEGEPARCSTSAAAGAVLRFISRNSAAPTSPASRCRKSNGSAPASARLKET